MTLTGLVAGASAFAYEIVDLGVGVSPNDINNDGVVVGSLNRPQQPTVAFVLNPRLELEELSVGTVANAVNDAGDSIGNTLSGAFLVSGNATRQWDGVSAYGINSLGWLSGNMQMSNPYRPSPRPLAPAVYDGNRWDVMNIARVYPRGTRQGVYGDLYVLRDLNSTGYAVGQKSRYGLAGSSAILIAPPYSAVKDAGDVIFLAAPAGGSAAAINSRNMIVGTSGNNSRTGTYAHAFLYDANSDTLTGPGTLYDGLRSSASDINESDQVVGAAWLSTVETSLSDPLLYHAFLWSPDSDGMIDLDDQIPADSGWTVTSATAINDVGDIVGIAWRAGEPHGIVLTSGQAPPPPPTVNHPPVAFVSADKTVGRVPLSVSFDALDSTDPDGDTLSYEWDFGDGTVAAGFALASHTYTKKGTYIVTLAVSNGLSGSETATVDIKVRKGRR